MNSDEADGADEACLNPPVDLRNSHVAFPEMNQPERPMLLLHQDSLAQEKKITKTENKINDVLKEGLKMKLDSLKASLDANIISSQQFVSLLSLFGDNEKEEKEHTYRSLLKFVSDAENCEKVKIKAGLGEGVTPEKTASGKTLENNQQGYQNINVGLYQSMNNTVYDNQMYPQQSNEGYPPYQGGYQPYQGGYPPYQPYQGFQP